MNEVQESVQSTLTLMRNRLQCFPDIMDFEVELLPDAIRTLEWLEEAYSK